MTLRLLNCDTENYTVVTFQWVVYGAHLRTISIFSSVANWGQRLISFNMPEMPYGECSSCLLIMTNLHRLWSAGFASSTNRCCWDPIALLKSTIVSTPFFSNSVSEDFTINPWLRWLPVFSSMLFKTNGHHVETKVQYKTPQIIMYS